MDIQADIKWIQQELINVKDPELITAFKSLLKFRQRHVENESAFDFAYARAAKDKAEGRVKPHADIRKKYEKWL